MQRGGNSSGLKLLFQVAFCCAIKTNHSLKTYFVNQLHNDQLQNVSKSVDLVNAGAEIIQSSILYDIDMKMIKVWNNTVRWKHLNKDAGLQTWSAWISIMKAFLLQLASFSLTRKSWISSGASGMRCSKFLWQINSISKSFIDIQTSCKQRKRISGVTNGHELIKFIPVDCVNC